MNFSKNPTTKKTLPTATIQRTLTVLKQLLVYHAELYLRAQVAPSAQKRMVLTHDQAVNSYRSVRIAQSSHASLRPQV